MPLFMASFVRIPFCWTPSPNRTTVSASKRGLIFSPSASAMRRRIVLVPMSIEATLLSEVGLDFTTEFLGDDVGRQFRVKGLEGSPVIQIRELERRA